MNDLQQQQRTEFSLRSIPLLREGRGRERGEREKEYVESEYMSEEREKREKKELRLRAECNDIITKKKESLISQGIPVDTLHPTERSDAWKSDLPPIDAPRAVKEGGNCERCGLPTNKASHALCKVCFEGLE